jgi:hypothetical protein
MGKYSRSLGRYWSDLGRLGKLMLLGSVGTMIGLLSDAFYHTNPLFLPMRDWVVIGFVFALLAPYVAYHRMDERYEELKQKLAKLLADVVKIDSVPAFDKHRGYLQVQVHNGSGRSLMIGVRIVSTIPDISNVIGRNLQIPNNQGVNEIVVGPGDRQLFDFCIIGKRGSNGIRLVTVGEHVQIPYQECELSLRAYTVAGPANYLHRFRIIEGDDGEWTLTGDQPTS